MKIIVEYICTFSVVLEPVGTAKPLKYHAQALLTFRLASIGGH